ncbi:MAG: 50S ribosomal protein L10 [Bacteroidetes bacterium]|nr:MAG: 50S ribosomal protein L10 [Bacteroidota bacterium]
MAMTKEQKTAAVDELVGKLEGAPTVYLTDYSGLTVAQANDLRGQFRDEGVEFKVVKNTLLKLAMDKVGGFDELMEYLSGPTAIAFAEEPAAPARVIKKFVKAAKTENPTLKGANVEGSTYHQDALNILVDLKSRDELLSDIIGLLMAPMPNIISAIQSPGSNLAGAIKVLAEREA